MLLHKFELGSGSNRENDQWLYGANTVIWGRFNSVAYTKIGAGRGGSNCSCIRPRIKRICFAGYEGENKTVSFGC